MADKGKIIVIEGIDGSGKATQTKILVDRLENDNLPVKTLDFPQYERKFFGSMVRQYLDGKFGEPTEVDPHLASLLYAADRWESRDKLNEWIREKKIIILDRYYSSNLVHQATKIPENELDGFIAWIEKLEFIIFQIPRPDAVLFLYMPASVAFELIKKRGKGHDGHDTIEHLQMAEKRCQYMAKKMGWITIECCKDNQVLTVEEISQKIWSVVTKVL